SPPLRLRGLARPSPVGSGECSVTPFRYPTSLSLPLSGDPAGACRGSATTRRSRGTRPWSARTSSARRSGASSCTARAPDGMEGSAGRSDTDPGRPRNTPTTQSLQASPRTAQRSQSMIILGPPGLVGGSLPRTLDRPPDSSGEPLGQPRARRSSSTWEGTTYAPFRRTPSATARSQVTTAIGLPDG